jgi:hypothetical protein
LGLVSPVPLTVIAVAGSLLVTLILERWLWTRSVFLGQAPRRKPAI